MHKWGYKIRAEKKNSMHLQQGSLNLGSRFDENLGNKLKDEKNKTLSKKSLPTCVNCHHLKTVNMQIVLNYWNIKLKSQGDFKKIF